MSKQLSFNYESNVAYERLVGSEGPFRARYELLVFAAAVGFSRGNGAPDAPVDNPDGTDDERQSKEMRWKYVDDDARFSVVILSLAYAESRDPEAILSVNDQIETLVKYGAAGSRILYDEVITASGDDLDNLVDFIQTHRDDDQIEKQTGYWRDSKAILAHYNAHWSQVPPIGDGYLTLPVIRLPTIPISSK